MFTVISQKHHLLYSQIRQTIRGTTNFGIRSHPGDNQSDLRRSQRRLGGFFRRERAHLVITDEQSGSDEDAEEEGGALEALAAFALRANSTAASPAAGDQRLASAAAG